MSSESEINELDTPIDIDDESSSSSSDSMTSESEISELDTPSNINEASSFASNYIITSESEISQPDTPTNINEAANAGFNNIISESEICEPDTLPIINEPANSASNFIFSDKSKKRYEFVYKKFMIWRNDKQINSFSENILLDYMTTISIDLKPSTAWSIYSMLRNTIKIKHNVDITKYSMLKMFLRKKSSDFNKNKAAKSVSNNILLDKSQLRYDFVYNKFMTWRNDNNIDSFSETVLLDYIGKICNDLQPSTTWSIYSMLRQTIKIKHGVDISKYITLKSFLKRKSAGFQSKKAPVLTPKQLQTFIHDAPDEKFLFTKVSLIFTIVGACRSQELKDLLRNNVQDLEKTLIVTVCNTKTNTTRSFTIGSNYYDICKKYINLRPPGADDTILRFFLNYQNGKCTRQVIGINKFATVPKQIAAFLNLPNPKLYTGHSFKRSFFPVQVSTKDNLTKIEQSHEFSKSSTVAEQYIENSMNNKIKIENIKEERIFQSLPNAEDSANMVKSTIISDNQIFGNQIYDHTTSNPGMTENIASTSSTGVSNIYNQPSVVNYDNCVFNIYPIN